MKAGERNTKQDKPKKKVGRPTLYTEALAKEICEAIANGNLGLYWLCEKHKHWPGYRTVMAWLDSKEEFRHRYTRARQDQADFLADEIIQIADNTASGQKKITKSNGHTETIEGDMIEHRKLQIDARKWKAAKLYPKKYGKQVDITSDGEKIVPQIIGMQIL